MHPNQKSKYMIHISNVHWNVTADDLKNLFGCDSVKIKYDNSGRSEGEATIFYNNYNNAVTTKNEFDEKLLDGLAIQFGQVLDSKRKSVFDRLGGKVFDRLGPKLEDRLGSRLDDRLGPKIDDRLGKKMDDRLGKKKRKASDKMQVDSQGARRAIKSYADTEVASRDGALI